MLVRARYLALTWARSIQPMPSSYLLQIHYKILPSTYQTFKWSLVFRFPHRNLVCSFPHSSWVDHVNNTPWIQSWSPKLRNFHQFPVNSSFVCPNVFLNTLSLRRTLTAVKNTPNKRTVQWITFYTHYTSFLYVSQFGSKQMAVNRLQLFTKPTAFSNREITLCAKCGRKETTFHYEQKRWGTP